MEINRIIWKYGFTVEKIHEWACPTCKKGILIGNRKNFNIQEDNASVKIRTESYWEPEWLSGVFTAIIHCNNSKCQEKVAVIGEMSVEEENIYDEDEYDSGYRAYEILKPKLFIPTLEIFPLNEKLPVQIRINILEAFSLFHADSSSCANKIRIVVENLMNAFKISKTATTKGKRKKRTLHNRIELFRNKFPDEGDLLMAIKWIGNVGSHSVESLTKDDTLDGFEILQHVINKLYDNETKRIKSLSKSINKNKGPISRK